MSDISTPAANSSYLLRTPFDMPSDRGNRWAVALSSNDSSILTAALSVIVGISFVLLWNLISFAGVFFAGTNGTPNRKVALLTIWSSNDPWFAFKGLLKYTFLSFKGVSMTPKPSASTDGNASTAAGGEPTTPAPSDPGEKSAAKTQTKSTTEDGTRAKSQADLMYGLIFCVLAFIVYGGGIAIGIVAPSLIQIGAVAPVKASAVFYPITPRTAEISEITPSTAEISELLQDFGLRAPGVMRSLGSVDAAMDTLRSRVSIKPDNSYESIGEDSVVGLEYGYNLSGVDMGLREGDKLALKVEGFCITEYGWRNETEDGGDVMDLYDLFGDPNQQAWVLLNDNDIIHAPSAIFTVNSNLENLGTSTSNRTYAVLIQSAHRSSITSGDDPWYATEPRDDDAPPAPFNPGFWMRRRRPVLSCWEKSTWTYGGRSANTVYDLKDIPGMKIARVLLDVLETALGAGPMITRLGNASGDSALRSRTTSPNGLINAQESSMSEDMQRLILASYVATRGVFTDAMLFDNKANYDNVVTGPDGLPKEGAGDFVVSDSDIQTFSLTGIVTLAAIFGTLLVTNTFISFLLFLKQSSESDLWKPFHEFGVAELLGLVSEE